MNFTLISLYSPYFFTLFDLFPDIVNKPPGNTYSHTLFNKKVWVFILVDLFKVKTIYQCHIPCFLNIVLETLTAHPRLLPVAIFLHCYIKQTRNTNRIGMGIA